jgi:hypothetical protein
VPYKDKKSFVMDVMNFYLRNPSLSRRTSGDDSEAVDILVPFSCYLSLWPPNTAAVVSVVNVSFKDVSGARKLCRSRRCGIWR